MYPILPEDTMFGAVEMVCYFFTFVGAVLSYVLTLRF